MSVRARTFSYDVALDDEWTATSPLGGSCDSERGEGVVARASRPDGALPVRPHELPLPRPPGGPRARFEWRSARCRHPARGGRALRLRRDSRRPRGDDRARAGRRRSPRADHSERAGLLRRRLAHRQARLSLDRQRRGLLLSATLLDVTAVRSRFTALQRRLAFFDGPGGTQVPDEVIDADRPGTSSTTTPTSELPTRPRAERARSSTSPTRRPARSSAARATRWRSARA